MKNVRVRKNSQKIRTRQSGHIRGCKRKTLVCPEEKYGQNGYVQRIGFILPPLLEGFYISISKLYLTHSKISIIILLKISKILKISKAIPKISTACQNFF